MKDKYAMLIKQVREKKPLVHHITNCVTVNDCANITLAIGASPIMADALEEVADITSISSALVLNMGTLNGRTVLSMLAAGKAANKTGIPVVFDPVGAGASRMRNKIAKQMLKEVKIGILCGNISEICYIAGLHSKTQGVDASQDDIQNTVDSISIAKDLSDCLHCIVAITGPVDVVSDGKAAICIGNGHPMLSNITGTGCMCSSLIGSFCGANPDLLLDATVAALLSMGIAGEIAYEQAGQKGNGSFRIALHDAVSQMDIDTIRLGANIYEA